MGILNGLPPGLAGFVAAQDTAQRRNANTLNQGLGILQMSQAMRQQAMEEQINPLKLGLLQAQVDSARAPQLDRVDLGGMIGIMDKRTGQIIGQLPKTASPDAMLGDSRARDLHAQPSGSALLGAQTTLQTHAQPSGSAILSSNTQRQLHGTPSASAILADQRARQGTPQYDAERGLVVSPGMGTAAPVMLNGQPVGPKPKDPPEALLKASGYADRMMKAEQILGANASAGTPGVGEAVLSKVPVGGPFMSNVARSPQRQQYQQAAEDWVRAKLRQESGAVIADEEMAREIRTYFPQLGDSPQVIAQKAQARQTAIQALRTSAGRAAPAMSSGATGGWDGQDRRAPAAAPTGFRILGVERK